MRFERALIFCAHPDDYIEGLAGTRGFGVQIKYGEAFLLSNKYTALWR